MGHVTSHVTSHVVSHIVSHVPQSVKADAGGGSGAAEVGLYAVRGLVGVNNATTPATQYDLSADAVQVWNPSDSTVVVRAPVGTLTNNILTAGPAANGRDQAGAFSASSWLNLYFIWNGTTVATLSSLSAPPTGPTLPIGYTHWAYAGAVRYNATPTLLPTVFKGPLATLVVDDGGENRVLAAFGTSTTLATVACSTVIPPNAVMGHFRCVIQSSPTLARGIYIHVPGQADVGQQFANAPAGSNFALANVLYPTDSSQNIQYKVDAGGGGIIDVIGYIMPNGG